MTPKLLSVVALLTALLSARSTADAQRARVPRVGFLIVAENPGVENAFLRRLGELGYMNGRNIIIESRSADGGSDRLPALAAELVRLGSDIIVAAGPEARIAAMRASSSIPIVTVGGSDPVMEKWAASLASPGGNVTGFTVTYPELTAKRLELLKEMIPGLSRVAVFWDPTALTPAGADESRRTVTAAARSLALDVTSLEVRRRADFDAAFKQAVKTRRQALQIVETAMLFAHRAELAERALKDRLPTLGSAKPSASAGYLGSYGADIGDLLGRAAGYVDRILKGAKPGDLPVERPAKLELVVNLRTAKSLGITIPSSVLQRTEHVIE
jgi:putative ABC transport system substrate-binding protein